MEKFTATHNDHRKEKVYIRKNDLEKLSLFLDITNHIKELQNNIKELSIQKKEIGSYIEEIFIEKDLHSLRIGDFWFYNRIPKTSYRVDTQKLKTQYPKIYDSVLKEWTPWAGIYVLADKEKERRKAHYKSFDNDLETEDEEIEITGF